MTWDVELAGLIFDALSSLAAVAALVIAVRAYKVAKEQGVSAIRAETLRQLTECLRRPQGPFADGEWVHLVGLLPRAYLPNWHRIVSERYRHEMETKQQKPLTESDRASMRRDIEIAMIRVMHMDLH